MEIEMAKHDQVAVVVCHPTAVSPMTLITSMKRPDGQTSQSYPYRCSESEGLYVEDASRIIDPVPCRRTFGQVHSVGRGNGPDSFDSMRLLLGTCAAQTGTPQEEYTRLNAFVTDCSGEGRRYRLRRSAWMMHGDRPSQTLLTSIGFRVTVMTSINTFRADEGQVEAVRRSVNYKEPYICY